jgi:hypothetical protein
VETLRAELMKGEARLRQLDEERAAVRDQLLRIDGAITALAELAEAASGPAEAATTVAAARVAGES